jgi:lipopolysaccharide export system protein LptA
VRPWTGPARIVLACFLCAPALAWAADPISFSADSVQASLAKDKEDTVLTGKARVKTGSISIAADRIELFGKDFTYLQCSGSVKVEDSDKKIALEAPDLYYDRTKKLLRAQGPSILQDEKNKLVLKAEWIESDSENEVTLAEIAVRIVKDKLACRSEYALYRRKDNILELTGAPSASKDGDDYSASRIVVNTDTDDIQLEGEVKGSVIEKAKASPAPPAPASQAPATAPPASPDKNEPAPEAGGPK